MSLPPACPSAELFQRALQSVSRALAADPELQITVSSDEETNGKGHNHVPIAIEDLAQEQIAVVRGMCDAIALDARYHDGDLHRSMAPAGPLSRAVYNELESLRVEACASRAMTGVAANLSALFAYKFALHGLNVLATDTATSLVNAFVLLVRTTLLEETVPETAKRFINHWQDDISALCGHDFQKLLAFIDNQAEYARLSLCLIDSLELVDQPEKGSQAKPADLPPDEKGEEAGFDQGEGDSDSGDDGEQFGEAPGSSKPGEDEAEDTPGAGDGEPEAGTAATVIPFPRDSEQEPAAPSSESMQGMPHEAGRGEREAQRAIGYHAYTTRYDEIVKARDLISREQLKILRGRLDQEISGHRRMAVKLAKRLQNSLKTLQKRAWTFDLDDGLLNTSRLPRLIIDPASPLAYKQEHEDETRDTVVSFLIDNSGSMRGQPISLAAMFTDILAQALEHCHVSTEILGFTTRQWRGGQTAQSWRKDNKPGDPGRLSDLLHIIYKSADETWRKARSSLGVMLWPELLKENIDGEALSWAHQRLAGRQEKRRILMVVSDGVPADDATLTANPADYLETHLHQVVNSIETRSEVELLAIGIGHDVSEIYQRSVTITDSEQLGDAMAHELIELLGDVPSSARQPLTINQGSFNN